MNIRLKSVLMASAMSIFLLTSSCDDKSEPKPPSVDLDALKASAVLDFSEPDLNLVGVTGFENGLGMGYSFANSADEPTCGETSSYIGAPDLGAIWGDGFTVAAWVTFKEQRKFERIIDLGSGIGENGGMNVTLSRYQDTDGLALTSWTDSDPGTNKSDGRLIAEDVISNDSQQFVVGTITPDGTMSIMVNGQVVKSEEGKHAVANVERTSNYIGRSNWCALDKDFKGDMSAVYVFNRVLSNEEISALYQDGVAHL